MKLAETDDQKFRHLLIERIEHHQKYLYDLLPQAEAYQREVEWMRERIDALEKVLEITPPPEEI